MPTLPEAFVAGRGALTSLIDVLGGGTVTRLVGGAVRDALIGLPVNDIDLATALRPREVIDRLHSAGIKVVPTGLKHGTVTAITPGGAVEVTTLRRDIATDGRHATVAFTDDWVADAARRDFTINALYADVSSGTVFDWFDGTTDLAARRVRFIGDPLSRIAEDHLRILRFFRFHARFGVGPPDAAGLAACTARANDLMTLSRERVTAEMLKLLASDDPAATLANMVDGRILSPIVPEIDAAGIARLRRLVAVERALALPADSLRRLAAILPEDAAAADGVAVRLKLSNVARKRIAATRRHHEAVPRQIRALAYAIGIDGASDAALFSDGDMAAIMAARDTLKDWDIPRLPISGGDLIARGLTAGPAVARTLRSIERKWVADDFPAGARLDAIIADAIARPPLAE